MKLSLQMLVKGKWRGWREYHWCARNVDKTDTENLLMLKLCPSPSQRHRKCNHSILITSCPLKPYPDQLSPMETLSWSVLTHGNKDTETSKHEINTFSPTRSLENEEAIINFFSTKCSVNRRRQTFKRKLTVIYHSSDLSNFVIHLEQSFSCPHNPICRTWPTAQWGILGSPNMTPIGAEIWILGRISNWGGGVLSFSLQDFSPFEQDP